MKIGFDTMKSINSSLQSHSQRPTSSFLEVGIDTGIGLIRCTTSYDPGSRPRTTYQSDRDRELAHARETYRQQTLAKSEKRWKQSALNSDHSTALSIKEVCLKYNNHI